MRRRTLITVILGILGMAAITLPPGPATAEASARSCHNVTLKVPRAVVQTGQTLRVAGHACSNSGRRIKKIRIWYRSAGKIRPLALTRTYRNGRFVGRVVVPHGSGPLARISVGRRQLRKRTRTLRVHEPLQRLSRVSPSKPAIADFEAGEEQAAGATASRFETSPDPRLDTSSSCALNRSDSTVQPVLSGCTLIASDSASNRDPVPFWGKIDCVDPSQHQIFTSGGDNYPSADGSGVVSSYRRLTVFDGDNIWGQRCELGWNNHLDGPTAFYREGQRRATFASIRLPENFHVDSNLWQTVFQMKQAQPSSNGGNGPILEMQVARNEWEILNDWKMRWAFPAEAGAWTRFAFDIYYSQDPSRGWIQVSADLNGDQDFDDPKERSPRIKAATLKRETAPGIEGSGLSPGDSIPSHLRAGVYQHPDISCQRPIGCSTEIANVQVMAPDF